jgi:DtxR family transcriptional regulator, Mn-dependent transcriptional regulator
MDSTSNLTGSLEDYLEAILILEKKNRVARVKDIADLLKVQMSSVSGAVKNLKARGLINYRKNSYIVLTEQGLREARVIFRKHSIILDFLENILLLPRERAEQEACKIEHTIGKDTTQRLSYLCSYLKENFESSLSRSEKEEILGITKRKD